MSRRRALGEMARAPWSSTIGALSARQVNLLLAVATVGVLVTGLTSWTIGTGWGRWWTAAHGVFGVSILVLSPAKLRGSVRRGIRRNGPGRWLSSAFGVLVVATIGLGFAHSTGIWTGVGYWAPLWTHVLFAVVVLPLLVWHVWSRPARPRRVDLSRRALLGGAATVGTAAAAVVAVETVVRVSGASGADRRFSGSHEVGSFDPDSMPTVSWLNDTAPIDTEPDGWTLRIAGEPRSIGDVRDRARPIEAVLDCTGGWWSAQRWDGVPVSELLAPGARSFRVTSATGYTRLFPSGDAGSVFLAVGYDGRALRRGHGAPLRLVAPGRRGPWWVKWVTSIEPTDRPWWWQPPLPLT